MKKAHTEIRGCSLPSLQRSFPSIQLLSQIWYNVLLWLISRQERKIIFNVQKKHKPAYLRVFFLFFASEGLEFYYSSWLHAEIGSVWAYCWQHAVESPKLVCISVSMSESSINTNILVLFCPPFESLLLGNNDTERLRFQGIWRYYEEKPRTLLIMMGFLCLYRAQLSHGEGHKHWWVFIKPTMVENQVLSLSQVLYMQQKRNVSSPTLFAFIDSTELATSRAKKKTLGSSWNICISLWRKCSSRMESLRGLDPALRAMLDLCTARKHN